MAGPVWTISNLIVFITCATLVLVLIKYGSNKTHYIWAAFNIFAAIWGLGAFLVGLAKDAPSALIFWKIGMLGSIPSPIIFYNVVVVLGNLKRKRVLLAFYAYALIFYLLFLFDLLNMKVVYIFDALYYIKAADFRFITMCAIWLGIIIYTIFELYKLYRESSGDKRFQFKFILVGFIFGFSGAILDAVPMLGYDIYPIANVVMSIYSVVFTYAILRHKLLDIEVIVKKTLVFAGLLTSVFAMLILPTLIIQEYLFFKVAGFGGRIIGLTISGVIIILTMRRIENFLINITDKYLFQKKYNYKDLLKTFTSDVLTVLRLDDLLSHTVEKLTDIVKLSSCAVLMFNNDKQQFDVMASRDVKDPSVTLVKPDGIVAFLEHTHGYLLRKELSEKKIFIPDDIVMIMDKLSSELIIPMILHEKVTGMLSLGKKKSDEDYSQDDLDILLPLARTLAIAISNAELFAELGKTQAEAAQKEKMAVIGTLSAGINHEICNPLGIARGQCEAFLLNVKDGLYASRSSDELLAQAQQIMAKVIKETDRATAITKKLSSFAKPAKGESELVDIAKELDEVFGLVNYELKLEKIELEKNISADLGRIFVDRKQFQEVLFNLLRNAGQAIGERGKITISAREVGARIIIDIKDTGTGIAQDKIKELFNPFFTTKDPGKGTGLGLFIVRQIVEKNGGRIYMKDTKAGEGTTFTIEFPAATRQEVKV